MRPVPPCCYCQLPIPWGQKTTEHLVPRSQGGSSNAANRKTCCRRCNLRRNDRSLPDWVAILELEAQTLSGKARTTVLQMISSARRWQQYIEAKGETLLINNNEASEEDAGT